MIELSGHSIIAGAASGSGVEYFQIVSRISGEMLEPSFSTGSVEIVDQAASAAESAFRTYRNVPAAVRAAFLRKIAENLEASRAQIVDRATHETALPEGRINGELGRTTGQLKMFADILEAGAWNDPRIDVALPERQPLPRPDVRSVLRPLGPVAVFGASNFPLAFSVAGGDTASALAAGCPVIVKAHPAHPGTSELAARAISDAVKTCGLPAGVFSLIVEAGTDLGAALVRHPATKAVGFTGSRRGGLALVALGQARREPIPVYAEMSSINPVVVLPGKLQSDATGFATGLFGSVSLGVGQFCTNPGLVLAVGHDGYDAFVNKLQELQSTAPAGTMLTDSIAEAYLRGTASLAVLPGVNFINNPNQAGAPGLFSTTAAAFLGEPRMQDEVFGPSTLIVKCATVGEAITVIESLEGQLTGSIFATESDHADAGRVVEALELKVGRLIFNQFPTGVEVCSAMVHGGPFPSTSDSRTTSVGGRAIERWVRPIAYQGFPTDLLPAELATE